MELNRSQFKVSNGLKSKRIVNKVAILCNIIEKIKNKIAQFYLGGVGSFC